MSKIEQQYLNLLKDILENGKRKNDRTGTGTISVFGRQLRHDFRDGFPLLTTKRMAWKQIVTELIWFLRGDTNIKFLVDNGCHIWDGDAYKNYWFNWRPIKEDCSEDLTPFTQEEFINKIKTDDGFAEKWGELGKIYGRQWRSWRKAIINPKTGYEDFVYVDQIANLISELKTNPDSRRLMVSAWNVGELDKMVLPPCHYGFQVYTRKLTSEERLNEYDKRGYVRNLDPLDYVPTRAISLMWNQRSVDTFLGLPFNIASYGLLLEIIAKAVNMVPDQLIGNLGDCHLYSNHIEQAKEQIGRDYTLEERLKFLVEKKPDFNPETDFGIGKDLKSYCHYVIDDHGVPRRTREPYPLPTLKINSGNENWHLLGIDDIVQSLDTDITFKLENYQYHPSIKAPLSN